MKPHKTIKEIKGIKIGDSCSAMGTCGITDGFEVTGTLTEIQSSSTAIITNLLGVPCQVNGNTLKKM